MPPRGATPVRPLSVSVRPARSSPSLSSGEGGSLLRGAWAAERKREAVKLPGAGDAGQVSGNRGSRRVGDEARGVAGSCGGRRSSGRVGPSSRPPRRAGSGGGTRRWAALLLGGIPLSGPLALLPAASPTPGRAADSERRGPGSRSRLLPGSGPLCLLFLLPSPRSGPALVSAQTFSETPPERSQPKQQGPGEEGTDGGREQGGRARSSRGTLGSVVREAGAGSSAARGPRPAPRPGRLPRPWESSWRGSGAGRSEGRWRVQSGFAILALPGCQFGVCSLHRIGSFERFLHLTT